jgi:c-di-GMP-binding flagellar brake protein YcgR
METSLIFLEKLPSFLGGPTMIDPEKSQKRRFVRANIILPVKYRKFTGNAVFTDQFNIGRTNDLSIGGVNLTVSKSISVDTKLDIEIELNDKARVYVAGQVLGGEDKVIDGISRRIEKINFIEIDPEVEDVIMKFIFDHERKEVRKDKKQSEGE